MSQKLILELSDEIAEALDQAARSERLSLEDVSARILEEWRWRRRFPLLEFRDFNGERHACVRDRLQVWQVIMVARECGMDADRTAERLGLEPEQAQAALAFYAANPHPIDEAPGENQPELSRVKALFPSLNVMILPPE